MRKLIILFACALLHVTYTLSQTTGNDAIYIIDGEKVKDFDGSQLKEKTIVDYRIGHVENDSMKATVHIIDTGHSALSDSLGTKGKIARVIKSTNILSEDEAKRTGISGKEGHLTMDKPLTIVDGNEFNGSLYDIKSGDIRAVHIYKAGSDEAKKYGEKGNNGVMKVTTKKTADLKVYCINGKTVSEDDLKNLKPDLIKSIEILKRGSKKAIEVGGENGETHDYIMIELK